MSTTVTPAVLRRSRDPQYLHLYRKCITSYQSCILELAYQRYPECIWNAYEVMEFFWKAISFLQGGHFPRKHLPEQSDFSRITSFLSTRLPSASINALQGVYARHNPRWERNPQERTRPRYGDERTSIPPSSLYTSNDAQQAVNDCQTLALELSRLHRSLILGQLRLLIGILKGTFSNDPNERACNVFRWSGCRNVSSWITSISSIPNTEVRDIAMIEIDNSFALVFNPYGETYPEKPSSPNILPGYSIIREYVFAGGVFMTAGGLPFTSYFDVTSGQEIETATVVRNVPVAFRIVTYQGIPQVQALSTTLLLGNLIQRDFNAMTTMDDPLAGRHGPTPVPIYQQPQDQRYWTCSMVGNSLYEFRSIDPTISSSTPIVRSQRFGREVYPLAFVRHGFGLLLHAGLDLSVGRNAECDFVNEAIRGVVRNYSSYF